MSLPKSQPTPPPPMYDYISFTAEPNQSNQETIKYSKMKRTTTFFFSFLLSILSATRPDPDLLADYCVADTSRPVFLNGYPCIDPALAVSSHFTTSALSNPGNPFANPFGFNVTITTPNSLPGANGQSLSLAVISLAPLGIVPLHSHPRASEAALVLRGTLVLAGFIDTGGRLFAQQLRPGDAFVFPRGMMHFLHNLDGSAPATVMSGMNSQAPGVQMVAMAAFRSAPRLPEEVLKRTFRVSGQDIQRIQKNLGG